MTASRDEGSRNGPERPDPEPHPNGEDTDPSYGPASADEEDLPTPPAPPTPLDDDVIDESSRPFFGATFWGQDSTPEPWSRILGRASRSVIGITLLFTAVGLALQFTEFGVRHLGAVNLGRDPPHWERIDLADTCAKWAMVGAFVSVLTVIVTRPRNAVIATVVAGSGILAASLTGTLLFATAPDKLKVELSSAGSPYFTANIELTQRSVAELLPKDAPYGPISLAFADQIPTLAALAVSAIVFWLLVSWIPRVIDVDHEPGGWAAPMRRANASKLRRPSAAKSRLARRPFPFPRRSRPAR